MHLWHSHLELWSDSPYMPEKNKRRGLYVYRYVGLLAINASSLFTSDNISVRVVPFPAYRTNYTGRSSASCT
jgi:hypothetical protein